MVDKPKQGGIGYNKFNRQGEKIKLAYGSGCYLQPDCFTCQLNDCELSSNKLSFMMSHKKT